MTLPKQVLLVASGDLRPSATSPWSIMHGVLRDQMTAQHETNPIQVVCGMAG